MDFWKKVDRATVACPGTFFVRFRVLIFPHDKTQSEIADFCYIYSIYWFISHLVMNNEAFLGEYCFFLHFYSTAIMCNVFSQVGTRVMRNSEINETLTFFGSPANWRGTLLFVNLFNSFICLRRRMYDNWIKIHLGLS